MGLPVACGLTLKKSVRQVVQRNGCRQREQVLYPGKNDFNLFKLWFLWLLLLGVACLNRFTLLRAFSVVVPVWLFRVDLGICVTTLGSL